MQERLQRQSKIACNGTNSAAIDQEGRLWVWGSGQFGLLGKSAKEAERKVNQFVPMHIKFPPEEQSAMKLLHKKPTIVDAYIRQEPLDNKQSSKHVVKDIAMGPCHMGIITCDEDHRDFLAKLMIEAEEVLSKVKTHFLQETERKKVIDNIKPEVYKQPKFA